jgi:hypothetical protein
MAGDLRHASGQAQLPWEWTSGPAGIGVSSRSSDVDNSWPHGQVGLANSSAAQAVEGDSYPVHPRNVLDLRETQLQAEVWRLRHRVRVLGAVVRLLLALLRVSGFRLEAKRLPSGPSRTVLLRAVDRARELVPLRAVLRLAGISSSRLRGWKAVEGCPPDRASCPRRTPNQLTAEEVFAIRKMVTSRRADSRSSRRVSARSSPHQRPGRGWSANADGVGRARECIRSSPRSV